MRIVRPAFYVLLFFITFLPGVLLIPAMSSADDDFKSTFRQIQKLSNAYKYKEAIPITEKLLSHMETTVGEKDPDYVKVRFWLGRLTIRAGFRDKAMDLFRDHISKIEKDFGPEHSFLTHPLDELSLIYRTQYRYEEALEAARRSLAIMEKEYGSRNLAVRVARRNLSLLEKESDAYSQANK